MAIEEIERPKARERMGARTDLQPEANFAQGSVGKVADIVGEAVGMSRTTYARADTARQEIRGHGWTEVLPLAAAWYGTARRGFIRSR